MIGTRYSRNSYRCVHPRHARIAYAWASLRRWIPRSIHLCSCTTHCASCRVSWSCLVCSLSLPLTTTTFTLLLLLFTSTTATSLSHYNSQLLFSNLVPSSTNITKFWLVFPPERRPLEAMAAGGTDTHRDSVSTLQTCTHTCKHIHIHTPICQDYSAGLTRHA